MDDFKSYLFLKLRQEMQSWNPVEAHDIYLIRLYIGLVDDDLRQAMLSGPEYYTTRHLKESGLTEDDQWDSPAAYRAGWHLFEPFVEAWGNADKADPEGIELRDNYLADMGLLMPNSETRRLEELWTKRNWNGRGGHEIFTPEDASEEERLEQRLERIGQVFVDAVGSAVLRLHNDGVVQAVCGRDVPLVLELSNDNDALEEYALKFAQRMNPSGVADEYFTFHTRYRGLSGE